MTNYKEILRLYYQSISQRSIATACECSRNTVSKTINAALVCGADWEGEYLHKEIAKSGVTLSLLWTEYCEICKLNGEIPFMYSQFCNYYRNYALKL